MKKRRMSGKRFVALMLALAATMVPVAAHGAEKIPALVAMQTGGQVLSNEKAAADASNLSEGYSVVKYTGDKDVRVKVQIPHDAATYTYNLNNQGQNETFPLTEGNGSYTVKVFENTSGNQYAQAFSTTLTLQLRNDLLPFLYPNQYVNYSADSKAVAKAAELTAGVSSDLDKINAIFTYVTQNISYDYDLASTVQSGYLPDVDRTLETGKGICFDYAALMTAMLRSQNIPSKLVVGYAGEAYHAWINVYIEGQGWIQNAIYFDGEHWTLMDPTYVSTGKASQETMAYVTNSANYSMKYAY